METKSTLQIPEGMEFSHVDSEGVIHLKPKEKKFPTDSWECLKGETFYITGYGDIQNSKPNNTYHLYDPSIRAHHQTKKQAEAFLALIQLVTLCKKWNEIDEFVPDFINNTAFKSVITNEYGKAVISTRCYTNSPLVFKTSERARQFFTAFKELIDIALPLI